MISIRAMTTVVAVAAAAAAGCGGTDDEQPQAAPPDPDSISMELPAPLNPNLPVGAVDPNVEGEVVTVTVTARGLTLGRDTLPAGQITVRASNEQRQPCALEVRSPIGGRWRSLPVQRGGTVALSMVLSRSPYYVTCETAEASSPVARDTARFVVR